MATRLAIFDVPTETTQTVLVDPEIVEAPNWLTDNSGLIVNKSGLIFRVPFDRPELVKLDTGFAQRCNNDHGISPCGTRLVISDATKAGASCIYVLPIEGGTPQQVTENTPSYWHGWSPDGGTLTYTAKRSDVFDIHTIPVTGGAETQLTSGFEHTDGPDYTPDGKWIWFNGEKDGSMDLWRIRPDGHDLEQMTFNASQDWFPHPDPTGMCVLYISYRKEVTGHPRDLPVELRLFDLATGSSRTLYSMTGGQGSINTPCWSPDGTKFAFVETVDA